MSQLSDRFDFAVAPGEAIVYARMWGVVNGADMLRLVRAVHTDPRWQDGFDVVYDCSAVRAHLVGPEEVEPIVHDQAASGDGHDVLVRSRAEDGGTISQMLAALCRRRGKAMTVHATLAEALAALGRDALPVGLAGAP